MRLSLSVILLFAVNFICSAQKPVDKKEVLTIGGIRQLIWLKGADDTRPIFLFLHGGPGNSVMPYAQKFCDQLYKHFIVVHWDQRGAGETAKLNGECGPFTLKTFQDDAEQLVDSLLERLGRKTLFVAGHSWGTALGFHLVRTRPGQISAFIAIGAMVNQWESERIALKLMKAKAVRERDTTALNELNQIQIPFQSGEQLYFHRKGLFTMAGLKPSFSKTYVVNWASTWLQVFNEASAENLFESLPVVQCPIYFFAGRNDFQTNSALVEQYFNRIEATTKRLYWFEDAGHSIPATKGTKMQSIIIDEIRKNLPDQKSND